MRQVQATLSRPVSCYGVGIHSGERAQLTLKPAKEHTGIVFVRSDISGDAAYIKCDYLNISDLLLSTSIRNTHNIKVSTIEHLMAALWGCGIDNAIAEIDGPEVPIMDGSSEPFVFMIKCAGKTLQNAPKRYLKILKDIQVSHKDCELQATPSKELAVDLTIDFPSKAIGRQNISFLKGESFIKIADARTFGFLKDVHYLKSQNLALGASLENAVGIDHTDIILNPEGLRHSDEFVRHKLLDLFGDLYTTNANIIGTIHGYKTSHKLNNEFLRKLLSNPTFYEFTTSEELS